MRTPYLASFAFVLMPLVLPAMGQDKPVALIGGTIHTVSGATIPNGTIIAQGGKILALGAHVRVPAFATRIDARGKVIIPGIIDPASSLFMSEEDRNSPGSADRNVLDGVDLFDDDAEKVLARGVTSVYVSPSRRGSVTGTGAVIKLRPSIAIGEDRPGFARVIKPQAAVKCTLGVSVSNRSSSLERLAGYEALRSTFKSAQQYAESFTRYDRAVKRYEAELKQPAEDDEPIDPFGEDPFGGGGGFGQQARGPQKPTKPRPNPAQDVLVRALKREIPVRIETYRTLDILFALRLADEFGFKLILERATEGHKVTREIAQRKALVVVGPTLSSELAELDMREYSPTTAARLSNVGVGIALSAFGATGLSSRYALENAAVAAGHGLSKGAALRAVTLGAAEILGVADRIGSLSVGKDADFVVFDQSPWSPGAKVEQVWIEGKMVRHEK